MKRKPLSFEDRLFTMTRNLVEYGNYGKSHLNAAKRLHSYFPEIALDFCENQICRTVEVYEKAVVFVEQNRDYYWQEYKKGNYFQGNCISEKEAEFIEENGAISENLIKSMIGWIFFWRHLK